MAVGARHGFAQFDLGERASCLLSLNTEGALSVSVVTVDDLVDAGELMACPMFCTRDKLV
jgi:hypothetical protein